MKKSELKALLRIITEEVVASKKAKLNENKGLSGFKKSKESTEHTEKVADAKSLTPTSEPKEKEEGKKLPVVKKPANPQKVGSIKEEILQMIREEIEEAMGRPKLGSVGPEADANTVDAIREILKANPKATDAQIKQELKNRVVSDEQTLNLDDMDVAEFIAKEREELSKETSSDIEGPSAGELDTIEKAKAAQRALWIKKLKARRGIK